MQIEMAIKLLDGASFLVSLTCDVYPSLSDCLSGQKNVGSEHGDARLRRYSAG